MQGTITPAGGYIATATSVKNPGNGHIGLQINITHPDMNLEATSVAGTSGSAPAAPKPSLTASASVAEAAAAAAGGPTIVHHNYYGGDGRGHNHARGQGGQVQSFWSKNKKSLLMGVIVCTSAVALTLVAQSLYNAHKARKSAQAEAEASSSSAQVHRRAGVVTASDYAVPRNAVVNPASTPVASPTAPALASPEMMTTVYQPMYIASSDLQQQQPQQQQQQPQSIVHSAFTAGGAPSRGQLPMLMPGSSVTHMGTPYRA